MDVTINDFYLKSEILNDIHQWLQSYNNKSSNNKSSNKILIIYGDYGVGKKTLAHIILKDYTTYYYTKELNLDDVLNKIDISIMFSNKKYKAIIFDNLNVNDKKILLIIKNIIKNIKEYANNPIILIVNTKEFNKLTATIKKKSIKINLKYTIESWNKIINKLLQYYNSKIKNNYDLLVKSNFNISNIICNINFHNSNTNNIIKYDTIKEDTCKQSNSLLNDQYTSSELFNEFYYNNNVIILNIINDLHNIINTNNEYLHKSFIKNILTVYESYLYYDINNNYTNKDVLIIYSILIPYYLLKQYKINHINIKYNKYISNSILYVSNYKLHIEQKYYILIEDLYYQIVTYMFTNVSKYNELVKLNNINNKLIKYYKNIYILINNI